MKKDFIRDYATEAFRFYAAIGIGCEELKARIKEDALKEIRKRENIVRTGDGGSPTEHELIYQEEKLQERIAEILDIEAVEKTLEEYKARNNRKSEDALQLIRDVYFKKPKDKLEKKDISSRVDISSQHLGIAKSTAYKYLKEARLLFAFNRGLRHDMEYLEKGMKK